MESDVLVRAGAVLRDSPRSIAIFGGLGIDNFGNDGSMEAILHFLKRECPNAQLSAICLQPEVIERTHGLATVRINMLGRSGRLFWALDRLLLRLPRTIDLVMRTVRKAREMDLLIVAGSGVLEEPSHRLWRLHWALLLWCTAFRINRKKIAFVSIGAAPIHNAVVRWMLASAYKMGHYRSLRDERSKRCVIENFGVDAKSDPVYPDIAFGLPEPRELFRTLPKSNDGLTIGLGPMSLWGWYGEDVHKAYIEKMVEFALFLVRGGHRVRLLIADKADCRAVDDFIRIVMMKAPALLGDSIVAEHIVCTQDLMAQIALTDVVVCSRFHNIIYALKQGKPVIGVGYSGKHRALLEEVGLGRFIQPTDSLDVALLQEQFVELVRDRKLYEHGIRQATAQFQARLEQQELLLASRFLG
jgi:polysaccharide pyruvyl transferase WcaK-like protein